VDKKAYSYMSRLGVRRVNGSKELANETVKKELGEEGGSVY